MPRLVFATFLMLVGSEGLRAQFVPALLQNRSYWGDGKSEIDFYQADFARDGEPRSAELLFILTPEWIDPNTFEQKDRSSQPAPVPAIELNQTVCFGRGLVTEQQSVRAVWRMDLNALARISFAGTDGIGQIAKRISERRQPNELAWQYTCDSYFGRTDLQEIPSTKKPEIFYDELPVRVRTINFAKPTGEFEVQLMPTLIRTDKVAGEFGPAKVSWTTTNRTIEITVAHSGGHDGFVLDNNFPFLLREWTAANGTRWKMKNSIKADYRKYLRNGDRERALEDPMLRHPD